MALPDAITYDRAGRVTEIEQELKQVPGALFTVRNMLGVDPDGGGVPDATETVKGKAELATVAEAVAGVDTTRIVTPAGLAAALAAAVFPRTEYFCTLTQVGTSAPVITEIVNNTGALVQSSYVSPGVYTLGFSAPIASDPSRIFCQMDNVISGAGPILVTALASSTTLVSIIVTNGGAQQNGHLFSRQLRIIAYQ